MEDNFPEITEILCPGDLVGYGARPLEVIEAVLDNTKITAISKGNWDHTIGGGGHDSTNFNLLAKRSVDWHVKILTDEIKAFLYQLPDTRTCLNTTFSQQQIALIHGSPSYPREEYVLYGTEVQKSLFPFMELLEINVLLLGHTHKPFIDKQPEDLLIVNPGSVGQPRDKDPRASYAVIDLENLQAKIVRVKYDIDKVYHEIIEAGLPEFHGKRLSKGI